jgi:hypothetical protein
MLKTQEFNLVGLTLDLSKHLTKKLLSEDTVFVQGRGVNSIFGQPKEVYSTFSGFMVVPNIGRTGVVTTPPPMGNIIG